MKYIKSLSIFNESTFNEFIYKTPLIELKKFCNDNLAYLIDDNFIIKIGTTRIYENHRLEIILEKKGGEKFTYNDVKDDFIPFISELVRVFKINTDIPKETIDYYNTNPEAKFKDFRKDLPEICKVEFIYKGKLLKSSNIQDIIDDSFKSILHKDVVYPINIGDIDHIRIKI
jgi:hypothetical protein